MGLVRIKEAISSSEVLSIVATDGYKKPPLAQSDITNLATDLASKVSTADFEVILTVLDPQRPILRRISYIVTDVPDGTGTNGEYAVSENGNLYIYNDGWAVSKELVDGDRFWHALEGSDQTGDSGAYDPSPNWYLCEWAIEEGYDDELLTASPIFGTMVASIADKKYFWFDGTEVVEFSSSILTANELLAIQTANVGSGERFVKNTELGDVEPDYSVYYEESLTTEVDGDIPAPGAGESSCISINITNTDSSAIQYSISLNDTTYLTYYATLQVAETFSYEFYLAGTNYLTVTLHSGTADILCYGTSTTSKEVLESGGVLADTAKELTLPTVGYKQVGCLTLCPSSVDTCTVSVKKNDGTDDRYLIRNLQIVQGATFKLPLLVIPDGHQVTILSDKVLDYIFVGKEVAE
jgi:hypothetical protein